MNVFEAKSYKELIKFLVKQTTTVKFSFKNLALHLAVSPVVVSQIFSGDRHLSIEQALETTEFFDFSDSEAEFFLLLVQYERAASHKLKQNLEAKIKVFRARSQDLKVRIPQDFQLTQEMKSIFYSNWYYSAIRNLCAIPGFQSADKIAYHLGLSKNTVEQALKFLIETGLCKYETKKIVPGPKSTHLENTSPLISRHHVNWRLKAIENLDGLSHEEEIFYSAPMSISQEDMKYVRGEITKLLDSVLKKVKDSPSETLACLNIDWFKIER